MDTNAAATLRANLDALTTASRHLVEAAETDGFIQLHSEPAHLSASVKAPDGRWVRIHSGHDPVTEANRFLDTALPGGVPPSVIVIGPGLGYVIDAIERRAPGTKVVAIEPFPALARAMLGRRDWQDAIRRGQLTLLLGRDYPGAADAWKALDDKTASIEIILEHPVIKREFAGETARARSVAEHMVRGAQSNANARKQFAGRYLLNTLANLPAIVSEGDVGALADLFPGVPAVVVAAGPSLDNTIQQLKHIADRVLIIAVDTTLRPLRAAAIRPQFVVAVDPSERNAMHLIGVPDSAGSWLVSEGSIGAGVFPEFRRRAFAFKVSNHHPWPWLQSLGVERGTLQAWGSVVTTAFDLACRMGCDPIVFVGTDLSYTGGLHYCRSTIHEDAAAEQAPPESRAAAFAGWMRDYGRATCAELDLHGDSVVSTPDFVQFRNWLVSRAVTVRPRRVFNATGAGILHGEGITQVRLEDVPLPAIAGGVDAMQARIAAAWDGSYEGAPFIAQFKRAVGEAGSDGVPMGPWLEFAGDTATSEQIKDGLNAVVCGIEQLRPAIAVQPVDIFEIPGGTAVFMAAAVGARATVQWQQSRDGGFSWSDIPGATAGTHAVTVAAADVGRRFRAVFTNEFGSTPTEAAGITTAVSAAIADFNGDGKPDVLWSNRASGANVIWYLNGATRVGLGELETVPDLQWHLAGAGDFIGDGKPDVLWRYSPTGDNGVWHLDGVNRVGAGQLVREADLSWRVVGTGDFNGDGTSDILWRHSLTGATVVWYMAGLTRTGVAVLDTEADLTWTIVGTGDFNGDGKPDILWRNIVTGANRVWYMDGVARTGTGVLDAETDLAWTMVGAGDFNGDGKPDILWHNAATGGIMIWYLDGVTRTGVAGLDTAAETTRLISREELSRRARLTA